MKSLYLSAGHSDTDPGATTRQPLPGGGTVLRKEADIAVEIRNLVAFYVDRYNADHPDAPIRYKMDGHGTQNLPLKQAAADARGFDIAVEFHVNAFSSPTATGAEVLHAPPDRDLARYLSAACASALGVMNRGAKGEGSGQHSRLAFVQAGGLIVEPFFLSNPRDLAAYDAKKWVLARELASVLIRAAGRAA